jgi:rare lipoprotein A
MKLVVSLIFILVVSSCQIKDNVNISKIIIDKKVSIKKTFSQKELQDKKFILQYVVGEKYFLEGVEYTPSENYEYDEIGLASYYGKDFHNIRTVNNDLNKVTEILGRHKTLPIPSVVKVTNLDNGLSLTIKIVDRHEDNSSLIQVSRKSAQLLKFYKNKIAKVRVEILSDPSKQLKIVTESINEINFSKTINSAPTEDVFISNLYNDQINDIDQIYTDQPVEIGFEKIENKSLYLKVYGFNSYDDIKNIFSDLDLDYKFTTNNEEELYSIAIGPLDNLEANNLVLSFISKGYKRTEFILE